MSGKVRLGAALVLVVLALTATGCQAIAEKAVKGTLESATGVKVDQTGDSVTIAGEDGQQVTIGGDKSSLPEGMPSDFPVYSGTIAGSTKADTTDATAYTYSITTADPAATVADWYKSELAAGGWDVQNSVQGTSGDTVTMSYLAKKGTSDATVIISEESGKTTVNGVLSIKK